VNDVFFFLSIPRTLRFPLRYSHNGPFLLFFRILHAGAVYPPFSILLPLFCLDSVFSRTHFVVQYSPPPHDGHLYHQSAGSLVQLVCLVHTPKDTSPRPPPVCSQVWIWRIRDTLRGPQGIPPSFHALMQVDVSPHPSSPFRGVPSYPNPPFFGSVRNCPTLPPTRFNSSPFHPLTPPLLTPLPPPFIPSPPLRESLPPPTLPPPATHPPPSLLLPRMTPP